MTHFAGTPGPARLRRPAEWLATWRRRRAGGMPAWTIVPALLAALLALPLATIVALSITAGEDVWPHLMRTVLPAAVWDTAVLLAGVSLLHPPFGPSTA